MALKRIGKNDCPREAKDLFGKLSLWREESYRQFSSIINCHSRNISDGIRDLTEEVCDLEAELSFMRKERSVLLETVDNLNVEIRQLNAKLRPLDEPGDDVYLDIVKEDHLDEETSEVAQKQPVKPGMGSEYDTDKDADYLTVIDQAIQEQSQYPFNNGDTLNDTTQDEALAGDVDENTQMNRHAATDKTGKKHQGQFESNNATNRNFKSQKTTPKLATLVCPECRFQFSTNTNLIIHLKNVHSVSGLSATPLNNEQTYPDYPTFQRVLKDYQNEKFVLFSHRGSDKNKSDTPDFSDKTLYPYKRLNLGCIHGMPVRQRGIGKRPNQEYLGGKCKAKIRLTLVTQQGSKFYGKYKVTTFDDNHTNHDVNETSFKMHSRNRRLTPQQRDFYVKEMKVGMDAMNR